MRPHRLLGAIAVIALLAGCGGDDKDTKASKSGKSSTVFDTSTTAVPAAPPASAPRDTSQDQAAAASALLQVTDLPGGWRAVPHNVPATAEFGKEAAACLNVDPGIIAQRAGQPFAAQDFVGPNKEEASHRVAFDADAWKGRADFGALESPQAPGCIAKAVTKELEYSRENPRPGEQKVPPEVRIGTPALAQQPFPTIGDRALSYAGTIPISTPGGQLTAHLTLVFAVKGRATTVFSFSSAVATFPRDVVERAVSAVVGRLPAS